ncbi:MAG: DNA repair exonuclease, partial [Aquabacterium sp.]
TGLFVREQMVRLGRAGVKVFIVQGNHDAQGVISRQLPWPDNVKVFSSRSAETIKLDDLRVAIHGHSFPDREVPEDLVPGYPMAVPGYVNIGLLHTSLTGAEGHDTYAPTSLDTLRSKGYDYWALGHVHARQVVCDEPRVVYPGNLQGRHARETGPKGCELVTVAGGKLDATFVPLDVVRWHQVDVVLNPSHSLDALPRVVGEALQAAVAAAGGERLHAMRVRLTGETPLHTHEARQPGTLAAAVQAAAQDLADADVWIEKVQLALRSPVDRAQLAQRTDALGELVRWVDDLAAEPQALASFGQPVLAEVLDKLPAELRQALMREAADDVPQWEDAGAMLALLKDAEATLLAHLNVGEAQP